MYALFRILPLRQLLSQQLPVLAVAWLVAEFFYKFHSFTLECGAFLATWFVLDAAYTFVARRLGREEPAAVRS